jgi:GAF domain-containing protein
MTESTAPEDALEPALRVLVENAGALAGALCLYNARDGLFRLAAEVGLSDAGCRRIRTVRKDAGGWTAPFESMAAGRAVVLRRPAALPGLVEPDGLVEAIACLPLFADGAPRGVVIAAAARPNAFDDAAVKALAPLLDDIGLLAAAIGRPPAEPPGGLRGVFGLLGPLRRRRRERPPVVDGGTAELAAAEEELARERRSRAEQERLFDEERRRSDADRDATLERAVELAATAEKLRAEATAESEAIRIALADVQRETLAREDELIGAMQRAAAAEAAVAERDVRIAAVEAALAAREAEAADGTSARLAVSELEAVRASLAAAQEIILREEERGTSEHAALSAAAEEARVSVATELDRVRTALGSTEDALRVAHEQYREREREHRAASAEREALAGALAAATVRVEALEGAAAEREDTLRRTLDLVAAAEEARAAAVREAETIRTALADSQAFVLQAEDDARRARAEAERLGAERRQLADVLEETRRRPASPATVSAPRPAGAVRRTVAVIDVPGAFADVDSGGIRVDVLSPDGDLPARLADLDPGRVLVNLAAPGALAAVAALRAAGCARRLWSYVGAPGAPAVLTLGMVEVAARPLDAEALLGLLAVYATRGTRVLAVGAEADAFISLRQAAGRQGMSLSIAWDDKQAADLVPMVRPEIVVVDLALPPRGGHGAVASLAELEQTPSAILVPRDGDGDGAALLAAAGRVRHATATPRARLVQAVLLRSEDRPTAPVQRK